MVVSSADACGGSRQSEAIERSAEALKPMGEAGIKEGVTVTVESHAHGIAESVDAAQTLLDSVPGQKLTLTPAHFVALGFRQDEVATLAPRAARVRLRQARQGRLQSRLEDGTINFPAFLGALKDAGYEGWLAAEHIHQSYMNALFEDVISETVKMRDYFRGWLD